jgi:hypothetical protein
MTTETNVPQSTLTVQLDGEDRTTKMTFGLLNEMVRVIGDLEAIAELGFDAELRGLILQEMYSERDEQGVIKTPVNLFNLDITPEDSTLVMEWVGSHVTHFLLNQMEKTMTIMQAQESRVKALTPTSTGLAVSASETPSS